MISLVTSFFLQNFNYGRNLERAFKGLHTGRSGRYLADCRKIGTYTKDKSQV
jgi:hypothetical protein